MIVLDTNVISEMMQPHGDPAFDTWFRGMNEEDLYTSAVTYGEIFFGIEALPDGKRKTRLTQLAALVLDEDFDGKVLPYQKAEAAIFATIAANLKRKGMVIGVEDLQIGAIALANNAQVATRNVKHFKPLETFGLVVVDPWR